MGLDPSMELAILTHAVPTTLHRYGFVRHHGSARGARAEVRVGQGDGFVAFGVAQGKGVVVLRWLRKVERASGRVVPVASSQKSRDIFCLDLPL